MVENSEDPSLAPIIRVVLLGTGIFASNCSFPTIRKRSDKFRLVGVWSRRRQSVERFVEIVNLESIPMYSGEEGFTEILQNDNIDALVIALPFDAQPLFIERALKARKHVLSEKPIGPTFQKARALVDIYEDLNRDCGQSLQWSVAENFRYEPALDYTAKAIHSGKIGKPTVFSLMIRLPFKSDNKYLHTEWRSDPSWYGGLLPDVFVHSTALLRKVFATYQPKHVSAITTDTAGHIPSIDSMSATLSFVDKAENFDQRTDRDVCIHGSVSLSFACSYVRYELEVTGDEGALRLERKTSPGDPGYYVTILDRNGKESSAEDFKYGGIEREFVAFADACHARNGKNIGQSNFIRDRNTPLEAMLDLELVEACLRSGNQMGITVTLPLN